MVSIELTILLPCLDEARTIAACVAQARAYLLRSGVKGEVLVADNGSTDGSPSLAEGAGARVIHVPSRGYGAALIAGIHAAKGRYVVMGDADLSYDFSNLTPFVEALRGGQQLVMGNRFAGGIQPGAMPYLHKYIGNPVLSFVGRLFFRSPIRDFHCGLRGFERAAILGLNLSSTGMEFASEMVVKATLHHLRISEVPTTLAPDGRGRPPHLRSWRDGWRHLRFLLIHSPAWLFLYPGLLLFFSGFGCMALLALGPLRLPWFTLDVHSMLYASTAGCIGLQMLMFAGAASCYAERSGMLPSVPLGLGWMKDYPLERFLLVALALFLTGLGLGVASVAYWGRAHFAAVDPSALMRIAIPASAFMMVAWQIATSAFLLEYIRHAPVSRRFARQDGSDRLTLPPLCRDHHS